MSDTAEGYPVGEAARRLGCSEATVRRMIGGDLDEVAGSSPLRVTAASLQREVERKLASMGISWPLPARPDDAAMHMRIEQLEKQVMQLKTALFNLHVAHEAVLSTSRELTDGVIPNN